MLLPTHFVKMSIGTAKITQQISQLGLLNGNVNRL